MNITHVFVPLTKAEKQTDGTMLVSGPITSSALDRDAQICDPDWLDRSVPQWFGEGGNVREMHSAIAAGKALKCWKDDSGKHWAEALVVDAGSVAKVEHGVLTGFSIGIKGARVIKSDFAPNGAIVDGQIIEVSLVDRPANPECLLQVAKSDAAGLIAPVAEQALIEGTAAAEAVAPVGEPEVIVQAVPEEPLTAPEAAPVMEAASEVRARAAEVLTALRSMFPAETAVEVKGDTAGNITTAKQAIASIARLIESEAQGLAAGDISEAGDISCLLDAVSALKWFISREENEDASDVFLADTPDSGKGDTPEEPASPAVEPEPVTIDSTKTEEPDGAPGAGIESMVSKMVSEALAEVTKSHEATLQALRDELTKVKAQPQPGGPVRVRTQLDKALAADTDRAVLLAEAARFEEKADAVPDRALAESYRALAAQKRAMAV